MKAGWKNKTLSELFNVKSSKRVHKADWQTEGIPFYRAREVVKLANQGFVENELFISKELYDDFTKEKGAPKDGDIIVSAVGTLGQCYLVKSGDKFYFKDASVLWLENISNVCPKFIEYAFKSDLVIKQVMNKSMGATVGTLTITRAKLIQIPIPPLTEQKQIVAILDKAFAAIDQAKAHIEKNIQNAQELFQSKLNEIFSQKGEGWEEKTLADIAYVKSGGTPLRSKKEYWENGKIPWYSSGELSDLYTRSPKRFITEEGLKNSNAKLFSKGSLLIGMYDTAALKMSIIDRDATFNQAVAGVEPNEELDLIFILHAINAVKPELLNQRRGVRQKNLSLTKIKNIKLRIPNLKVQKRIVAELDTLNSSIDNLIMKLEKKNKNFDELKKSILQKAFAGELTS